MHTFFVHDLENDVVALPEEEAGHALRVLRLKEGDRVLLVNGKGTRAHAELGVPGKRTVAATILQRTTAPMERRAIVHLAVAPTKSIDRLEWLLEKATEIGVDRITPVITARTERQHLRTDRLQKVLVSAMKQSQRSWLPQLDEPGPLKGLLENTTAQRFFGWCEGERRPLQSAYAPERDALILIGPEGDLTTEEATSLIAVGYQAVSLGAARLRTETAALAALTWMNFARQS